MAKLVVNVEDVHVFGDGDVINLVDNPFFLGEASILDERYIQKLEILEVLIRKRRVLLQELKGSVPTHV